MAMLIAAAAAFLLLHLIVSGTRLRDALASAIGQRAYLGLFSLASIVLLAWLILAYRGAREEPLTVWWVATPATKTVQLVAQLVAFLLAVPGLMTRNPTSVGQEGAFERPDLVVGMLRITRHPFLWGVALWAAGHLMVNGDAASLVFFGSLLVLALSGTASIDAKRQRAFGERWSGFAAATSNVPFAAIAARRQRLSVREIGAARIAIALLAWIAAIIIHRLSGAPVLP